MSRDLWRVGTKVPINVYEGDRPVCQCHNKADAARIVEAVNGVSAMDRRINSVQEMAQELDAMEQKLRALESQRDALLVELGWQTREYRNDD